MATKAIMSVEEYLRTSWPDGDREYVHGEVIEKPMPPKAHAKIQKQLLLILSRHETRAGLCALPELRCEVAPGVYRLPDVVIFMGEPEEEVPSSPAYATIEILSPDDRMTVLLEKLREYRDWGVAHVWVVDPEARRMYEFNSDGLRETGALLLPEYQIAIQPAELFTQA
jgi:Uma2 family endonuclease